MTNRLLDMDQETERKINRVFEGIYQKADVTPVTESILDLSDRHPARVRHIVDGLRLRLRDRYRTSVINVKVSTDKTLVVSITHP
jgi:hypothetical protein